MLRVLVKSIKLNSSAMTAQREQHHSVWEEYGGQKSDTDVEFSIGNANYDVDTYAGTRYY